MTKAIVPGSFDPVTKGHMDIILRAKELFDQVSVGVLFNESKKYLFTPEQKKEMLCKALEGTDISVIIWDGMLYELCEVKGFTHIVKGARPGDMEYEENMAEYNSARTDAVTVILPAREELSQVSSTFVRQRLADGASISALCPVWRLAEDYYVKNTKM